MTASDKKRLGLRDVRDLPPNSEVWDAAVPGFGARRQRSIAIAYVLLFRTPQGRTRRLTIGRHGAPWTPETAREEARRLLGDVAKGLDPAADKRDARRAMTVAALCDRYFEDAKAGRVLIRGGKTKKAATISADLGMIESHIKPVLGRLAVVAVKRADIERLMHAIANGETKRGPRKVGPRAVSEVRGGRGVATRTIGLLGAIFNYAVRQGYTMDNPVRGVQRPADQRRERRLTDEEYGLLGAALRLVAVPHTRPNAVRKSEPAAMWPAAVAAAKFLAVTGWRSSEALGLRWGDIDLVRRTATLPDSKTGRSMRPLSREACNVLLELGRGANTALAFLPTKGKGTMTGFRKFWDRIIEAGRLPAEITPHVLRHSFASLASDLGYSEPTIAALVGHKGRSVTSRYIHSADAVLLAAADAVAGRTAELMGEAKLTGVVVDLHARAAG